MVGQQFKSQIGPGSQGPRVQRSNLGFMMTTYVTLGKCNMYKPQFPYLHCGVNDSAYLIGLNETLKSP